MKEILLAEKKWYSLCYNSICVYNSINIFYNSISADPFQQIRRCSGALSSSLFREFFIVFSR